MKKGRKSVRLPFVVKPVVNGVHLLQKLLQIRETICHDKERHGQRAESEKTLEALSKSWFFQEDHSNEKDTVRLPRHGINTGRKTLIYQAFSDFKL